MGQLQAKIQKMHEQVNFLSTYIDHEYPVKAIQIATMGRQLQQLKDNQRVGGSRPHPSRPWGEAGLVAYNPPLPPQEELEDLREKQSQVLRSLSDQLHRKRKNTLHALLTVRCLPLWWGSSTAPLGTHPSLPSPDAWEQSLGTRPLLSL